MLSRRSVRVKVMKSLYAANQDSVLTESDVKKAYKKSLQMTYDMYLFNLHQLVKVAEFANQDAANKAEKLLPTAADKNFSTRLYNNPISLAIAGNSDFAEILKKRKLRHRLDSDMTHRFYRKFAETETYKNYLALEDPTDQDHIDILLALYKLTLKDEIFEELVDDQFNAWESDKSLVVGAMKKTIKSLPINTGFLKDHEPNHETCMEYGFELLHKVLFFEKDLEAEIEPVLKNWDMERVAVIDMVILKMALCELMHFNTIPPKVTINEYVDLAKVFSTPKSKEFVNGVLDKLNKKLTKEGKIRKEGRGLIN